MVQLKQLLQFDRWANQQTLDALEQSSPIPEKALQIAAHLVGINEMWLSRAESRGPALDAWPHLAGPDIQQHLQTQSDRWISLVESDPQKVFRYKNRRGEETQSALADLVFEIILHAAHHRGQIALLLRQHASNPPASTDYIPALRAHLF